MISHFLSPNSADYIKRKAVLRGLQKDVAVTNDAQNLPKGHQ